MTNPTSNKHAGRKYQAVIAKRLGGQSVGTIEGQDVKAGPYSIECKKRKAFVATNWMDQCVRNCPEGKLPIVMVHVTGSKHDHDLVMVRLKDWEDWYGQLNQENVLPVK